MKRLRKHISYSNVTASLALILALSGTAYAALAANSVRSRHIAPNAAKGVDVSESSLGPVPVAKALQHPELGPLSTMGLIDGIGIGMIMGRVNGVGSASLLFANPHGVGNATVTESSHVMGTFLAGSEVGYLKVQLLTGTMPAGATRTFTLREGNTLTSMSDTAMSCEMDEGDSQCGFEGEVELGQLDDMLSLKIETTGSPPPQTLLFGYSFTEQGDITGP